MLCRGLALIGGGTVAVDGSRFKAVNTRDKSCMPGAIQRRIEQVDAAIARYLAAPDTADRQENDLPSGKAGRLKEKGGGPRWKSQCMPHPTGSERTLRRQIPKVGAVCGKSARTVLCGGAP